MRDQRKRGSKKQKKKKKSALDSMLMVIIIIIATVCVAMIGVFIGKGWSMVAKTDEPTKQYAQIKDAPESEVIVEPINSDDQEKEVLEEKRVFNNEFVNILVVGVDKGDLGREGEITKRDADSILLLNYYYGEKVLNIVSIPRDTGVSKDGISYNLSGALKQGGIDELVEVTEEKLKTKINNYIIADIGIFEEIVNIIDGVGLIIPYDMKYDDNMQDLHIDFNKGDFVTLTGEEASDFVRWRMNNDGWMLPQNDVSRMEHLKVFMMKVVEKVKTSNFTKLGMLGEVIGKNVTTDIGVVQIVRYVMDLNNIGVENVTYNSVNGDFIRGIENDRFTLDMDNNREILRLINGSGIKNISRDKLKVNVVYDTSYDRIEEFKEKIKVMGYEDVSYVSENVEESVIQISSRVKDEGDFIANDFDIEKFEILSQMDEKFDIILKIR